MAYRGFVPILFALSITACAGAQSPEPAEPAPQLGPGLQRLVDMATEDLGKRLGVDASDIGVVSAEFVTWPDASLGCPQPGFQYMQVLTNGSRIELRVRKDTYHYHSGGNRRPFPCAEPSGKPPVPYAPGEA